MGVRGAAIATVVGQGVAGITAWLMNIYQNKDVEVKMRGYRPSAEIIKQIYKIGVPSIIMQSIGSVMIFCLNKILIVFSTTATAVFGVYFKLQSFIFMPVFGLNNGVIPVIAYNYGAGNKERVVKAIKASAVIALLIMTAGVIAFQTIPDVLLKMFDASETMLFIGVPALRVISLSFIFAAVGIACSSAFQALGYAFYSMLMSIVRQLVVLLPVAYLLSMTGEVRLVWFAFPIAEVVAIILCAFFMAYIYKTVISKIGTR